MKLRVGKAKSVKNQFVLNIGDEGAIFCYFEDGKLLNKLYAESPASPDTKLMEKLMTAYPKTPVSVLVDVIEQNYSQQVLPPVSSFGIRQQVQRRMKRDLQANDFNNFLLLNRAKEGRKEWNFLFVSLANSDPFAKWLEVVLNQDNPFAGVYLLPLEVTKLQEDINKASPNLRTSEWELLVLHNKIGGFRIIAFREGKLIFTRLAQNMVGDNIPDIIVGNMEQEISNTVEYLKRMAFKGEAESKITIVAGSDILQKIDTKNLKFGSVDLYTPFQIAEKLNLPEGITEKDKFADILAATHFAASKKHLLKFNSPYTKKLEQMYNATKAATIVFALVIIGLVGLIGDEVYEITLLSKEKEDTIAQKKRMDATVVDLTAKKKALPTDIDLKLDIKAIVNQLPPDKYQALRIINEIAPLFDAEKRAKGFNFTVEKGDSKKNTPATFKLDIDMTFLIPSHEQDFLNSKGEAFLNDATKLMPKYKITWVESPKMIQQSSFEQVNSKNVIVTENVSIPAKISISGEFR